MSTEKNQSRQININTNILKFPNQKENLQLEKQRMDNEKLIETIAMKMDHQKFDQLPLLQEELLLLSNHGETIEFPPLIAARLISVLATQLKHNSLEEFI
jgi:hypothetical protein